MLILFELFLSALAFFSDPSYSSPQCWLPSTVPSCSYSQGKPETELLDSINIIAIICIIIIKQITTGGYRELCNIILSWYSSIFIMLVSHVIHCICIVNFVPMEIAFQQCGLECMALYRFGLRANESTIVNFVSNE